MNIHDQINIIENNKSFINNSLAFIQNSVQNIF